MKLKLFNNNYFDNFLSNLFEIDQVYCFQIVEYTLNN